jgi:predicted RNase H-like HicB family nuclease
MPIRTHATPLQAGGPASVTSAPLDIPVYVRELEARIEKAESLLAALEIVGVDGYVVKLWPEEGEWIAHCPTARCVVQEASRDEALAAIRTSIGEMLEVLSDAGAAIPTKDIEAHVTAA